MQRSLHGAVAHTAFHSGQSHALQHLPGPISLPGQVSSNEQYCTTMPIPRVVSHEHGKVFFRIKMQNG